MAGVDFQSDDELIRQYLAWTSQSLDDMQGLLDKLVRDPAESAEIGEGLYAVAHNIKGMGGSFGYALMTEIGSSLCAYLKRREGGGPAIEPSVITVYLQSFRAVMDDELVGDGGDAGQKLMARLSETVGQSLSSDNSV